MSKQYRKITLSAYNSKLRLVQDFYYDTVKKTFEPITKNSHITKLTSKMIESLPILAKIFCLRNNLELLDLTVVLSTFSKYNNIQITPIKQLA
jgi:hypothetical protein